MISTDKIPRHSEIFCHSHHAEILNFPRICGKINRLFQICEETEVIILADFRNEIQKRRTFAIISHPDAGKTTLTEKFLLYGGAIAAGGRGQGQEERARARCPTGWKLKSSAAFRSRRRSCSSSTSGYCINILDTPGHQDFSEDTYRTLMAADSRRHGHRRRQGRRAADATSCSRSAPCATFPSSPLSTRWTARRAEPV